MLETPRTVAEEADGLGQLKTLLFRGESTRLKAVETLLDAVDARVGDAPRLEASTSEIIVEALRRAEVARHEELARAIAPVVVASIRNEIRNSREMMVEALYPLTGQLVVAAVSNAVRDMLAIMNERLDRLTSLDRWKLRLRARIAGRPASELALSESARPRLSRVLFLERGSGVLLASWRADHQPEERGELIGGLIAALTGFARDALGDDGGELRTLDFGGRDIYLRASPNHIVAAEVSGALRGAQIASLNRDCDAWLAQYSRTGQVDDRIFGDFIERALEAAAPPRRKGLGWPLKMCAAALALLVVAVAARSGLRSWREYAFDRAFERARQARPALMAYPLALDTSHSASRVEIRGLASSPADVEALTAALREVAGDYAITTNVGLVATDRSIAEAAERASAANARVAMDIAGASARIDALGKRLDDLAASAATGEALAAARAEQTELARASRGISSRLATTEQALAEARARAEAPRARLASLIDGFAIFFDRDRPRVTSDMNERLDSIARLLGENEIALRVIGYSDETGSQPRNQSISRQRADTVAELLIARGAPKSRLVPLGRASADPIGDQTPEQRERNRRVVFEIAHDGELAP